jgi:hypothetical protein
MVHVPVATSDDPAFVDLAERALNGAAALASAEFLHLVKIDAWFGDRWFTFAGKLLGAVGVHEWNLKVPPFHPHRVLSECRFRLAQPPEPVAFQPLHTLRSSASNLENLITRLGNSITLGWYSGNSAESGRGSIMAYSSTAGGPVGWYAGLERAEEWRLVRLLGADERQWARMLHAPPAAR